MADNHIGYLIKQVFLMNQAKLNTMFAEFDLTASQTFTLIYLFKANERGQQVHQKDIENAMDISNPSVTGILNRLEHKGLIHRVASTKDARVKISWSVNRRWSWTRFSERNLRRTSRSWYPH
ncbi:MAG: MarR family winged helix-turn-helix transcriptional regulator [Clostridium sp.]